VLEKKFFSSYTGGRTAMKNQNTNGRSGLLSGGNWIVDQVKLIDIYPQPEQLGNIRAQSQGTGGAPYNVLVDLAKSGAPFPLYGAGLVGRDALGERVSDVKPSQRLTSSASCLVASGAARDRALEKLLAQHDKSATEKPILEINLKHPLVAAIAEAKDAAKDLSFLLLEQAQILDGELPEDPAAFASRLNRLVLRGIKL